MCPDVARNNNNNNSSSSSSSSNGAIWIVEEAHRSPPAADLGRAVASSGYGLFNIFLLLAALPIAWTCIIDATSTAFVINSTECVFELTMLRRGLAVSAIFIGMLVAGPLWDFWLHDAVVGRVGKRDLLILGMLLDVAMNLLGIHATSFYAFVAYKFISGLTIAGPLSVVMPYLGEFHAPSHQPRFARWAGLLVAASIIIPPGLAAWMLRYADWLHFSLFGRFFYPTWRVYLLACALPPFFGLLMACLLPQSPKFLASQGKNDRALRLLRAMYSLNHFRSGCEYPVTQLVGSPSEKKLAYSSCGDRLRDSISKVRALFSGPHSTNVSILLFLQFCSMAGFHVMRLWVPPLWVMMNNFRVLLRQYYPKDEFVTMCEMIFPRVQKIDHAHCNYTLPSVEATVYVNSTIIATSAVVFGFIFALLATTKYKKIGAMVFLFTLSATGSFGANWAWNIPYMLVMVAFVIVASRVAGNTVLAYSAEVIPAPLRPTATSLINFIGNLGGVAGNVMFAVVLAIDCLSAFFVIGFAGLVCSVACLLLIRQFPERRKPDLQL